MGGYDIDDYFVYEFPKLNKEARSEYIQVLRRSLNMNKILMISGGSLGIPSPSRICMNNIALALKEAGHDVYIICRAKDGAIPEDEMKSFPLFTVKERKLPSKSKSPVLCKIQSVGRRLCSFMRPYMDRKLSKEYFRKMLSLCDEYDIGTVVVPFYPIEAVEAVYHLKCLRPNVKAIVYELDSVGDGVRETSFTDKLSLMAINHFLRKVYNKADKVNVVITHKNYWLNTFGAKYKEKLQIMDIPVLTSKDIYNIKASDTKHTDTVSFLYSGQLAKSYRSPDYLLKVMAVLANDMPISFDFYSKGDCEDTILKAQESISGIRQCGYVSENVLNRATCETDFLVSIGNTSSNSVPSKLISYFTFGKPIIHFASQKEDICKSYLNKYPLALVIDESAPLEDSLLKIKTFIKEVKGKTVEFEKVKELFYMSTPEYSVNLICENVSLSDSERK